MRVSNDGKVGIPLMQAYEDVVLKKQLKKAKIPLKDLEKQKIKMENEIEPTDSDEEENDQHNITFQRG
jgi:hypothetical protein